MEGNCSTHEQYFFFEAADFLVEEGQLSLEGLRQDAHVEGNGLLDTFRRKSTLGQCWQEIIPHTSYEKQCRLLLEY